MSKTRSNQDQICQMSTKSSKICSNRRQIGKLSTKSSKMCSNQRQIGKLSTKSSKMCSNRRQIGKLSTKSSKMCSNQSQICQIRVMVQKTVGGNKQKMNSLFPELFIFCLVADGFVYGRLQCHVDDYSFILFSLLKCRYHLTKAC